MSATASKVPSGREFRQEEERIDRRWMYILWALLLPLLVVLAFVAKGCFSLAARNAEAQGVSRRPEQAAEVSHVSSELFRRPAAGERLKQQQRKTLEHYGWVDRQHGIVRVPIDVAMDLVLKEQP